MSNAKLATSQRHSIVVDATQGEEWDGFVRAQGGHLLQTDGWARLKQQHGWQPYRIAVVEQWPGRILAGALLLYRNLGPLRLAYIPRGPIVDWNDLHLVRQLHKAIHNHARRHRAITLTIEPNCEDDPNLRQRLTRLGFVAAPPLQPRNTITVDLSPAEDAILAAMKPKTRYNIRLAQRKGVQITQARNAADVAAFYAMMQETAARDQFGIHTLAYYQDAFRIFGPQGSGQAALFLAHLPEQGDTPIGGLFALAQPPEGIYMYGASSERGRAAMPNHLLQWQAMQWAKSQGCAAYDMWGIPADIVAAEAAHEGEEQQNVRGGLWGVYRFKQGFGGRLVNYVGAWDYDYLPLLGRLYRARRPRE